MFAAAEAAESEAVIVRWLKERFKVDDTRAGLMIAKGCALEILRRGIRVFTHGGDLIPPAAVIHDSSAMCMGYIRSPRKLCPSEPRNTGDGWRATPAITRFR